MRWPRPPGQSLNCTGWWGEKGCPSHGTTGKAQRGVQVLQRRRVTVHLAPLEGERGHPDQPDPLCHRGPSWRGPRHVIVNNHLIFFHGTWILHFIANLPGISHVRFFNKHKIEAMGGLVYHPSREQGIHHFAFLPMPILIGIKAEPLKCNPTALHLIIKDRYTKIQNTNTQQYKVQS